MENGRTIAIIPARGGSKRIPRKNIKGFCGKPIIAYSIEAAVNAGIFDVVMVSTDDEEIAEISKSLGAEVPFLRSEEAANDYATTYDVLAEVLREYQKCGESFQYICCIYPTAPFVTAEKLRTAMNLLLEKDIIDAVVPIVKFSFPPQRGFVLNDKGEVEIIYPETFQMRSQDFEANYHDCGQYYCMKVESLLKTKRLVLEHTIPIITSELEVQDIDNLDDWEIAELKYKKMISRNSCD